VSGLLVVGGSYAGIQAALSARQAGYLGAVTVVCDEDWLPYQRPPLSKAFLVGETSEQGLILRGDAFFEAERINLVLGHRVSEVDRRSKRAVLANGNELDFDKLVLATGSRARKLSAPGADLDGVCYLRSIADALDLRARLASASEIVVIGGGFIGLEVASSAAKLGKKVTVIESAARVLERALSPLVSSFLLEMHRAAGVEIILGGGVTSIEGRNGSVAGVKLASGITLRADLVLVGIGGLANDELAQQAGLKCANGIVVDDHGRTEVPEIYAAGDCASHYNNFANGWVRLESVQNAQDQAKAAGLAIADQHGPYESVPRFWSDQYDLKLQIVGLSAQPDHVAVRGSVEEGCFSAFHYKEGRLVAVESLNRPGDQMASRRLIASGISPQPHEAESLSFDLKSLVKATGKAGA
jgi:3-phenylpropionate/trans-cinnamate dioxygenase ferredoxin reductase subunit